MFCPACAHNNPDAAATCSACGGALPRPQGQGALPPPPYPGPAPGAMPPPGGMPYGAPPYGAPYGAPPYGAPYGAPPYGAPYPYGPPGPYGPPVYQPSGPPRTSGMAIAGFILSFFGGILGLVFSILGYNESRNSNGMIAGQGLALAGIIISIVMMIFWIMIASAG